MVEPKLKGNVYLVDWSANWEARFKIESDALKDILGSICLEVHHIGSTAIRDIKSKPIVDILVVVRSLKGIDSKSSVFVQKCYEVKGENGIKGRRYFQKNENEERAYHIHAYEIGDINIAKHLLFRDSLRASPEKAREYERLKEELAEKHKFDKPAYTSAKTSFITKVTDSAVHEMQADVP